MMTEKVCCDFGPSKVGTDYISNDIKTLQYPKLSFNERKRQQQYLAKQPRQTIYNLGNGLILTDPDKATDELMRREFNPILKVGETPHEVIFSPDTFLFDQGIAAKAVVKTSGRQYFNVDILNRLKKYDPTLEGSQEEEHVYNALKEVFITHNEKNTVVINGWKDAGGKNRKMREYDFLIISEPLKTIFHIEVKTAMTEGSIAKAADQLNNGKEFFESIIPLPVLGKWKYVRVMSFAEKSNFYICDKCQQYVIVPDTNLSQWWSQMKESKLNQSTQRDTTTYLNIMKYLLHQQFRQEDPITESELLDQTVKTTDEMGIFFWSKIQYSILNNVQNKRVALITTFGTGKTTLLKEKAKMMEKSKEVIYIVFSDSPNCLLKQSIENEFKFLTYIKVLQKPCTGEGLENDLKKLVEENPNCNVFMDEIPVGADGIKTKFLNELARLMAEDCYLWFACQSQTPPSPLLLKEYIIPELNLPLRYPSNMLKTGVAHREAIGGARWPPKDFDPDVLLNRGNKSLFFALKPQTSLFSAVNQLAFILEREVFQTIIKIEEDNDKDEIIKALQSSSIAKRLVFEENNESVKEFICSSEKILVVTSKGDSSLKGFEVPLLVIFSFFLSGSLNENLISRCKSKLIVICDEEHAVKIVPSDKGTEYGQLIHVYDQLMPSPFEDALKIDDEEGVHNFLIGRRPIPVDIRNEASQTGLMLACSFGSEQTLPMLLENKDDLPNLEAVDSQGWTALHYASSSGSIVCLESLIKKGIDVCRTTNNGETGLHLASERGHLQTVKSLIEQNCPIDNKTCIPQPSKLENITKTALHLATKNKHVKIVECLLMKKADVKISDENNLTALHIAAEVGNVEIAKMLLENGADIEAKKFEDLYLSINLNLEVAKFLFYQTNKFASKLKSLGKTPLHVAAENGNLDVIKLLCEQGSDIEAKTNAEMTALHFAAQNGSLDVVKYLFEQGCDIEAKTNIDRKTPLHMASEFGSLDVVKFLCEQGSNIETTALFEGKTPLHDASENGNIDVVKYLCERGSNIEAKTLVSNLTPLHVAAKSGKLDVVKYLCEQGSNIETKTGHKMTMFHAIAEYGLLFVGKYFWSNKIDLENAADFKVIDQIQTINFGIGDHPFDIEPNINLHGMTALHVGAQYGNVDVVKYLCEQGSNIEAKSYNGLTTLMHAVMGNKENQSEVVTYLVEEQKVNLMEKDKSGKTCFDHAKRDEVKEYLKSKGVSQKSNSWCTMS